MPVETMKTKGPQYWFILLAVVQCLCGLCFAVYPAPGSYYSVLLRYNSRAKTRKVARIAPSPHRLWAYFNPPSALGALNLEAIDNNIGRHLRNRWMAGRLAETSSQSTKPNYISVQNIQNKKNLHSQIEEPSGTEQKQDHYQHKDHLLQIHKANYRKEDPDVSVVKNAYVAAAELVARSEESMKNTDKLITKNWLAMTPKLAGGSEESMKDFVSEGAEIRNSSEVNQTHRETSWQPETSTVLDEENIEGTCGGTIKISLTPIKPKNGEHGRFFQKTIKSVGFPKYYETGRKCLWTLQVSDECQMGMIVHEIQEGNLLQSRRCSMDSLSIVFNGKERERLCGPLKGHVGSYKWTQSGHQHLNLTWQTRPQPRKNIFPEDTKWGFKLTLSGYCWVYSAAYLSSFVQKELRGKTKHPEKPLRVKDEKEREVINSIYLPPVNENHQDNSSVEKIQLGNNETDEMEMTNGTTEKVSFPKEAKNYTNFTAFGEKEEIKDRPMESADKPAMNGAEGLPNKTVDAESLKPTSAEFLASDKGGRNNLTISHSPMDKTSNIADHTEPDLSMKETEGAAYNKETDSGDRNDTLGVERVTSASEEHSNSDKLKMGTDEDESEQETKWPPASGNDHEKDENDKRVSSSVISKVDEDKMTTPFAMVGETELKGVTSGRLLINW